MNFQNHQMDPTILPQLEQIQYHKIEKNYLYVLLLAAVIVPIILTGVFSVIYHFQSDVLPPIAGTLFLSIIFFILALALLFSTMAYRKMAYAIRERDVIFKKGWIWQSTAIVPFNRVQHCEVNQNPIERIFGLSRIKVFTAGGSSSDLVIPGLLPDRAAQLKSYIINKTAQDEEE